MELDARSLIIGKICPTCQMKFGPELERCSVDNSFLAVVKRDPFIGKLIGDKYRIEEILGVGGFSTVYKADQSGLRRSVAVKILNAEFVAKADKIRRFQHEAEMISTLVHSNVATVYDYGVLAEGQPYLVMEYAPGKTLSDVLSDCKVMQGERAVEIFLQVCDGVIAAHNKGLIHRDLKPSNIVLLQSDDGADQVKILDFGLAKVISEEEGQRENLTLTGEVLGTPAYMAPEQCMGTAVDVRTDIYCFACVMYEVLSGSLPLDGETSYEVMHKHINESPISLSKSGAPVPQRLVRIVSKALQKDPDDRYQNFGDLKEALLGVEPTISAELKSILFSGSNLKLSKKKKALKKKVVLGAWISFLILISGVGLVVYEHVQRVREVEISKEYAGKIANYVSDNVSFQYPASFFSKKVAEHDIVEHFEHRTDSDVWFDLKHLDANLSVRDQAFKQRGDHATYGHFVEIKPIQPITFGAGNSIQAYETEYIHDEDAKGYRREHQFYWGRPGSIWKIKIAYPLTDHAKYEKTFDIVFNTIRFHPD